jgi:hypothetical protein
MISPEQWQDRKKQWELFDRWKSEQPLADRDPADIIADMGAILDWLPAEALAEDPDPAKGGIQKLRAVFELLNQRL